MSKSTTPALQVLSFHDLAVRVQTDDHGNPWFCAKDVCKILGYANPRDAIKKLCQPKGVANSYPLQTTGGIQHPTFINEGNLYRLIIKSTKPEAEPFESWVCDDVIPAIRKTGRYQPQQQPAVPKATQAMMDTLFAGVFPPETKPTPEIKPKPDTITLSKDRYIQLLEAQITLQTTLDASKIKRRKWTAHEEAVLKANYEQGLSLPAIAKLLDRSLDSIETRLYHLNIRMGCSHV